MRQILLLTASSLLVLACGIPRPDTDLCVVNAPAKHQKCYNLNRDYNDNGKLKPTAQPSFKPAEKIEDLNKNICTDPDGFARLKAYIRELRDECQNGTAK